MRLSAGCICWGSTVLSASLLLWLAACGSDDKVSASGPGTGTEPPVKTGVGVGEACTDDEPCRTGLDCVAGACEPAHSLPQGETCMISAECQDGLYCDPQNRCATAGSGEEGDSCATDVDCQSGLKCFIQNFALVCIPEGNGDVGGGCTTSADCFGGLACQSSTCQQLPADAPPYGVPTWSGETCDDDTTKPTMAYFEVPRSSDNHDFYRLPFPNDIRLVEGHPDLSGHPTPGSELLGYDPLDPFLRAIESDMDGWGAYPTVFFRFSNAVDWDSFDNGVNPGVIRWVDITPGSSLYAFTLGWSSVANSSRTKYLCPNWLTVRPPTGEPLVPGHTYAVILSTAGLDKTGVPIERAPDFEAMLDDTEPVEVALRDAHESYQVFRDYLASEAIGKDLILNAAVFTVSQVREPGETLAESVAAQPVPTTSGWVRCGDGPSPCPQAQDDRACGDTNPDFDELHALVSLPVFQQGTAPYLTQQDGGGFQVGTDGTYELVRTEDVCLSMTIPKNVTMPAEGWPVVLFAHGTGGSFRSHVELGLAEALADAGNGAAFAVVGIDQVQHGPRRGGSDASPNDLFFNFGNPLAAKYNPLQGAGDQLALVRMLADFALDASASPTGEEVRIDGEKIMFWGHSQGATHGSVGIPYAPSVKAVVLSGNGASLMDSLVTKTNPVNIAAALPYVLLDINSTFDLPGGTHHPVLSLLQTWIDPADPLNYGPLMSAKPPTDGTVRHCFQPFGQLDTYSPAKTMLSYIIAADMERVEDDASVVLPDPDDDREMGHMAVGTENAGNLMVSGTPVTALTRRYGSDGYDGHFVAFRNSSAQADILRFLSQSATSTEAPQVGP